MFTFNAESDQDQRFTDNIDILTYKLFSTYIW